METLVERIKALARQTGYAAVGVTDVAPFPEYGKMLDDRVRRWPNARDHYERLRRNADPARTTPWARSIIVCVRRYGKYRLPEGPIGHIGREYLCDDRYEGGPDHHLRPRLLAGLRGMGLRAENTGALPFRLAGARAGTVRCGRNSFAYTRHGSWIRLHTFFTDAELPSDEPTLDPPCPEGCRSCMDACPTGALCEPYMVRLDSCVSHLTYAAPYPVARELWEKMGRWVYGCDICQEVCPLNRGKWEPLEGIPWLEATASLLAPEALAEMDEETYRTLVQPHFPAIAPTDLSRWHANGRRALRQR